MNRLNGRPLADRAADDPLAAVYARAHRAIHAAIARLTLKGYEPEVVWMGGTAIVRPRAGAARLAWMATYRGSWN